MEIKKFNSFLNINENYNPDASFEEKLREDFDILDEVKSVIQLGLEKINDTKDVHDSDEFKETLLDSMNIDETNLSSFDLSKEIDLCIYNESAGGSGCPACEWDDLAKHISDGAVNGLITIVSDIIDEKFINEFNEFMEKYDLDYSNISWKDGFDMYAPKTVKHLENGELYKFRNLDGEYNIDVYHYHNTEFDITLYIKKEV